jgi:hypothetical protein
VLAKTFALNEDRTPIAPEKWQKFEETVRGERELQLSLRKEIAQECALPSATFDDVHIILPKAPSISHHKKALVRDTGGRLETMTDHIDLDGWKKSYEQRKLRGYCFATAGMEAEMATAIEKVLQKRFGIVFDHHAREEAKL